jgi:HK97 gp10 family phage protein
MSGSFSIKFDPAALNAGLDELARGSAEQVRPAAQAGAQVLYEEVKIRAPVKAKPTVRKGKVLPPGALKASIYQVFSRSNSDATHATYHISWNAKKAPHGHLVEVGTSRAPAHPFLRPAYDAKVREALAAANQAWIDGTRKVLAGMGA